jgi:hypothetical protein
LTQFFVVDKAEIVFATCSCPIELTCACGHVVGMLCELAKYKMLEASALPEEVAKTSQPHTWNESRGVRIHCKEDTINTNYTRNEMYTVQSVCGNDVHWKAHIPDLQASVKDRFFIPAVKLENVETVNCKFGQVPKCSVLSYQQKQEENCIINFFHETSFPELPNQNYMVQC